MIIRLSFSENNHKLQEELEVKASQWFCQCEFWCWRVNVHVDTSLELCVCVRTVADSSSNWAVCGKSSGMVSMPMTANATHKVQIEVMPLFAGHLPFPKIKVLKYLPHTAAVAIQPDPGKTPTPPRSKHSPTDRFVEVCWEEKGLGLTVKQQRHSFPICCQKSSESGWRGNTAGACWCCGSCWSNSSRRRRGSGATHWGAPTSPRQTLHRAGNHSSVLDV